MGNDSSKRRQGSGNDQQQGSPSKKTTSVSIPSIGKSGPSNAVVQKHIENAKKSRVLQLKGCGLKKVPDSFGELATVIRNLELCQNKIRELPASIGNFIHLKQLHVSDNLLESLPDEIGMLKKLEVLNLHGNKLSKLPDTLVGCGYLKTLTLSSNSFTVFPRVICDIIALDTINLDGNRITTIPDEIATLKASEMSLNQNGLHSINAEHLSKCVRLKILRVEENCLAKTEFTKNLLEDSTLSIIRFNGNLFQDRDFQDLPGYEQYQERFTATKRKM